METVRCLAAAGADVVLTARNKEAGEKVAADIKATGVKVSMHPARQRLDVSRAQSIVWSTTTGAQKVIHTHGILAPRYSASLPQGAFSMQQMHMSDPAGVRVSAAEPQHRLSSRRNHKSKVSTAPCCLLQGKVSVQQMDLTDLASVRAAAAELQRLPRIDLLILNAGVMVRADPAD